MDVLPSQSTPALSKKPQDDVHGSVDSDVRFQLINLPVPLKSSSESRVSARKKGHGSSAQSACMGVISSFPIIQESPRRSKSSAYGDRLQINTDEKTVTRAPETVHGTHRQKTTELKIKMESGGSQLEEDDDLDMCPARTRPNWPQKIIPCWNPSYPNEKPPYSYAILIAHAILTSKDGRLTLSEIYQWISQEYPYYVLGEGGWQNSIRHNLSLKKEHFLKLDRRQTQKNPGKGSYWTLLPGKEQHYVDQITLPGNSNRRHHDIGLTAELSMHQRRSSCLNQSQDRPIGPHSQPHMMITTPGDYEKTNVSSQSVATSTATQAPERPSSMYTTFRMTTAASEPAMKDNAKREINSLHRKRTNKKRRQQPRRRVEEGSYCEDEYDSGVDVSSKYVSYKPSWLTVQDIPQEVSSNTTPAAPLAEQGAPEIDWLALLQNTYPPNHNDSIALSYAAYPTCTDTTAVGPSYSTVDDLFETIYYEPTWCAQGYPEASTDACDTLLSHDTPLSMWLSGDKSKPFDMQPSENNACSYPTLLTSRFENAAELEPKFVTEPMSDEVLENCLKEVLEFQQSQYITQPMHDSEDLKRRGPITINLGEDEVTAKYLHFEEGSEGEESGGEHEEQDSSVPLSVSLDEITAITQGLASSALGDELHTTLLDHEYISMHQLLYS